MSLYPTNTKDQATAADCAALLQCVELLTKDYEANLEKRDVDIGFNLFELISDHYHRETFHSDILKAFLDPAGEHKEQDKYLKLFLEFLRSQHAVEVKLSDYSNAEVVREKGRVDILIEGLDHAIIIENKIKDASDTPRQLPDYLKKVKDNGYECDAIIYLRLHGDAPPDETNWTDDERMKVRAILRRISAYNGTDDETKNDLLKGWILKCVDESKDNANAQHILRQYGDIIKKLGKNIMNKPIMEKFYQIIIKDENLKTALSLKKMLDDLVLYRVNKILDKFKDDHMPFPKITIHNNNVKFVNCRWNNANLGLDIEVKPESYLFDFWDTANRNGSNGHAESILQRMGCRDDYTCKEGGVFGKKYNFSLKEEEDLIKHTTNFLTNLGDAMK